MINKANWIILLISLYLAGCESIMSVNLCERPPLSQNEAMQIIDEYHYKRHKLNLNKKAKLLISRRADGDYVFYDEVSGVGRVYIIDCNGNVIFEKLEQ